MLTVGSASALNRVLLIYSGISDCLMMIHNYWLKWNYRNELCALFEVIFSTSASASPSRNGSQSWQINIRIFGLRNRTETFGEAGKLFGIHC